MSENIEITSGYAVVSLKKERIKGHVFLGLKDDEWKEWRVISENKEDAKNYSKIKVSINAVANFWQKNSDDMASIGVHTQIRKMKTEISDTNKQWAALNIEKADINSIEELIKDTLNYLVFRSSDTIKNLLEIEEKKEAYIQ